MIRDMQALADPLLPQQELARIAGEHPGLRRAVREHPNVYASLAQWIEQQPGDPWFAAAQDSEGAQIPQVVHASQYAQAAGVFGPASIEPQPLTVQPVAAPIDPQTAAGLVVDPRATMEQLADIAAAYPDLRAYVRVHPNCYPDLAQWIDAVAAGQ